MREDRLKRLARSLDTIAVRDEMRARQAHEIDELRRRAAVELHTLCAEVVRSVNRLLTSVQVELTPQDYSAELYHDSAVNLFQINLSGRVIQISVQGTDAPVSTEIFKIPYILQGEVRWYNQEMMDRDDIPLHQVFYCLEKGDHCWRYYDPQRHRTGDLDQDYLVSLMEQLV